MLGEGPGKNDFWRSGPVKMNLVEQPGYEAGEVHSQDCSQMHLRPNQQTDGENR